MLADRLLGDRSVGYVEWEPYCQEILKARQADGCIDVAPVFGDVREFVARGWAAEYRGIADVVAGGFPCQPFSCAGKQRGDADERNMWPSFRDVVREVRPRYVFAENVPGLLTWDGGSYFGKIVGDLAALGYGVRWTVLGADDVGAPHRRKRLWILAYREDERIGWQQGRPDAAECGKWWSTDPADVPDPDGAGQREQRGAESSAEELPPAECCRGSAQPFVGRVAHGVANRVDRLRAIGNGQVPLVAATAWRLLGGPVE